MLPAKKDQSRNRDFTTGIRAITPTNRMKLLFNIEAAFQWASKYSKHVSIFLSKHEWIKTTSSSTVDAPQNDSRKTELISVPPTIDMITEVLSTPDDAKFKIPPLYIHISGTPVMTTENDLPG